jgi:Fe/S biogenesis protein NfuA
MGTPPCGECERGGEMITFTDTAREKVREYMNLSETPTLGVRVVAHRFGKHQFRYELALMMEGETKDEDVVVDQDSITVYLDPQSAEWLEGASVDFVTDTSGTGFQFNNPQAEVSWDDPLAQRVQKVIDERIAPSLAGHGGWVELLEVDGDAAVIQFGGGCQGCGMSQVTLKEGIETAILEEVPEIKRVLDNTDHESGATPYYAR